MYKRQHIIHTLARISEKSFFDKWGEAYLRKVRPYGLLTIIYISYSGRTTMAEEVKECCTTIGENSVSCTSVISSIFAMDFTSDISVSFFLSDSFPEFENKKRHMDFSSSMCLQYDWAVLFFLLAGTVCCVKDT